MNEHTDDQPLAEPIDEEQPSAEEVPGGPGDAPSTDDANGHDRVSPSTTTPRPDPLTQAGETIVNLAAEAAYTAVGFAGFVGDRAKAFYEEQSRQYAKAHPEEEDPIGSRAFLRQMAEHLEKMVDDITQGIKDMADRGRATLKPEDVQPGEPAPAPEPPVSPESSVSPVSPGSPASPDSPIPPASLAE